MLRIVRLPYLSVKHINEIIFPNYMKPLVETATMSKRGQIIIPKSVRKYIKAEENTLFAVTPLDNHTIGLRKMDRDDILKEFERIRKSVKNKMSMDEINEVIREVRAEKRNKSSS